MSYVRVYTLAFILKGSDVLLGYKTRGLGEGLWNGFGGKVEQWESIIDGARREIREECDLNALRLNHIGIVSYEADNNPEFSVVHIFACRDFTGEPKGTEEMNPVKWFSFQNIPYNKMWPDAKYWYKQMLNESNFYAHFRYNENGKLTEKNIRNFDSINEVLKHYHHGQ